MLTFSIFSWCSWSSRHKVDFPSIDAPDLCIAYERTHCLDSNGTATHTKLVPMRSFHKMATSGKRIDIAERLQRRGIVFVVYCIVLKRKTKRASLLLHFA